MSRWIRAAAMIFGLVALPGCPEVEQVSADTADTADTSEPVDTSPVDTVDAEDTVADDVPDVVDADDVDDAPDTAPFDPWAADARPTPDLLDPPPPAPVACIEPVNGGAETGDISGWTVDAGVLLAKGDTNAFDGDYGDPWDGFFQLVGGESDGYRAHQDVDVSAHASLIDAGSGWATVGAHVRTREGKDEAWLGLVALDEDGDALATWENGPFLDTLYRARQAALALPVGTRAVRITLRAVRIAGDEADAWFDEIGVCVHDQEPRALDGDLYAPPYLMDVRKDSVVVRFETRRPLRATVDYGDAPDALDRSVTGTTPTTRHELRLTGLTPGSRPWYQVRWGHQRMPPYQVRVAPPDDSEERVEFVMFADNQDGPQTFRLLAREMALLDPDFVLSAGDCVQNGQLREYREWLFEPLFGLTNRAAMLIGAGNHETYVSGIFPSAAAKALYDSMVTQPGDEHCFGWRWGPLFLVVIDTERDHARPSEQYTCIEEALASEASETAQFRTAIFHRPALVQNWDQVLGVDSELTFFAAGMDAPDVRAYLAPLFETAGVDLVFNGHNHLYQYVPAYPETVAWVTSGGGGGGLESGVPESQVNDWSEYIESQIFGQYHFLRVVIDQGVLAVRAVTLDGTILHEFQLSADAKR